MSASSSPPNDNHNDTDIESALREMEAVVAAAGPSPKITTAPESAVDATQQQPQEEPDAPKENITAKIDLVDPAARIAQLTKMQEEMRKNFTAMKRVYGAGPRARPLGGLPSEAFFASQQKTRRSEEEVVPEEAAAPAAAEQNNAEE